MIRTFAEARDRYRRAALRGLRTLATAAGVGVVTLTAAAEPPPAGMADVSLARAALAAVDADPHLRDVNLVVSVVDRVAVVGGPVPAAELGQRAEWLVRRVPGVADVQNRCFVQAGPDPLIRAMTDRAPGVRRPFFTDLPPVVPGVKLQSEAESVAGGLAVADPAGPRPVVARRPATPGDNVLLAPVGAAGQGYVPPPTAPLPPAFLTSVPPAAVPGRAGDVAAAAEAVRAADARYAGLRVEGANGVLVVVGTAARATDAWDLAQALRTIPGAARVAVGSVVVK